jgi:hypothetical protein
MDENPYASPATPDEPEAAALTNEERRRFHARRLRMPAVFLLVLFSLDCVYDLLAITFAVKDLSEPLHDPQHPLAIVVGIGGLLVLLVIHAAVLWGAIRMFQLRSYKAARFAAFVAIIPVLPPSFFLAMPIGIWSLLALNSARRDNVFDEQQPDR